MIDVESALTEAIAGRRLLSHPYYRSWQEGTLAVADLARYAAQYRHIERRLPEALSVTASRLPAGTARRLVEANLTDEQSWPRPHMELFDGFAAAVGASDDAPPTPATAELTATYSEAAAVGPCAALAVIGAYETQAAEIAATKAASLREYYGLDEAGTEFWDTHAFLEGSHADWTVAALEHLDAAPALVAHYAAKSADAWWAFLDEQDAAWQH